MEIDLELLQDLKAHLDQLIPEAPRFAFVLGTGLSGLTDRLQKPIRIPYDEFKEIPNPTTPSHDSAFYFGYLREEPVLMMGGRFHYYEGHSMKKLTLPVRLLCMYKLNFLWIANAAGGVNENYKAGDIVMIRDHINMMPENPLRGKNDDRLGDRFPDMLKTYNRDWNKKALAIAKKLNIRAHEGVYLALQGPNLETPAEYEMVHRLGGDVVGMSTVPEVLVAKHMNTALIVNSVVANVCYPIEAINETSVEDVIREVNKTAPKLEHLVEEMIDTLKSKA